jgi:hypothetical protein
MSISRTHANPRAKVRCLPEIDPFRAGERWLQGIRLTREYLEANARAPLRPETLSSLALHAAARRPRAKAFGALGRRLAVWLRRRLTAILTR